MLYHTHTHTHVFSEKSSVGYTQLLQEIHELVILSSCPRIHSHTFTERGDDATFHQMFPMIQLSRTAATGPPKHNTHTRTQKESWSQAHPITYINNNALTPALCINTPMLIY